MPSTGPHAHGARTPSTTSRRRSSAPRQGRLAPAVAQQSLRGVLSFCNARQMTAPEAYIQYSSDVFTDDGEVTNNETATFLRDFMAEFRDHVARVLTVLPRST